MLYRTQGLHAERGCAGIMSGPSSCFTALTFHMLGCFCSSLVQGKIRDRGSKGEPGGMCHHGSRLRGLLYNKEVIISRSIVRLTVLLHSENEPLLILSVSQKLVLLQCDRGVICKCHCCATIAI